MQFHNDGPPKEDIPMAWLRRLLPVAVFGVVLLGCVESSAPVTTIGLSGKQAPEISGPDADGKEIKLSDYRGKVVLVDFWFDECPPCRINHGNERHLVEKFKGRPFIILGVNIDANAATMRRSMKEQQMTWPSIWDGKRRPNSRAYEVAAVPTVFLVDHLGRLATEPTPGLPSLKKLEQEIEQLVREAENSAAPPTE
jgi:peroxiredoxin